MLDLSSQSSRIRLAWAGFAFVYLAFVCLAVVAKMVGDEIAHFSYIEFFEQGKINLDNAFTIKYPFLTMLPGYHVLSAAILWALNQHTLSAARVLNALYGMFAIAAFYRMRRRAWGEASGAATLQFALLPILFPYNFLVYTDVLSLAVVLAAGSATLSRRHVASGALMIVALCMRQTNVIWLPLYAWVALSADRAVPLPLPSMRQILARTWPYAVGIGAFLLYWAWHGSISLAKDQAQMHPDLSIHVGNIYFALFLCGVLFPLHVAMGLKSFVARVSPRPWLLSIPLAVFALYWLLFRVDHPFNQPGDALFLHNYVIQWAQSAWWAKAAFGLIAVAAACGLANTRLHPPGAWVLYPLTLFALASSWMIEHRYALVPIVLWLVFRERQNEKIETVTTALWAVIAVCFCLGTLTGRFSM